MKYVFTVLRAIFNPFGLILFNSGDEEFYSKRKWFITALVFIISLLISILIVFLFNEKIAKQVI